MFKVFLLSLLLLGPAAVQVSPADTSEGLTCSDVATIKKTAIAQMAAQTKVINDKIGAGMPLDEYVIRKAFINSLAGVIKQAERYENTNCPKA